MAVTAASIAQKYDQQVAQATAAYNQQTQGIKQQQDILQQQMNQLKGAQEQDQSQIAADQANILNVQGQQKDLSSQMAGSGSVGAQYQASIAENQQNTGYNEQAMERATANQQLANGALTAYQDKLKTAWSSSGQSAQAFQYQQQSVQSDINKNIQGAGKAVNTLYNAYKLAQDTSSAQATAYYQGEQNQMEGYSKLSNTYQNMYDQSMKKYQNDVDAYNQAASDYTIASWQYSFITNMYTGQVNSLRRSQQNEVMTRIDMPAIAAQINATASQMNAIAAQTTYAFEEANKPIVSTMNHSQAADEAYNKEMQIATFL